MTAIAGILRFDRAPVERRDVERMASALRSYGPDRTGMMVAGPIGLTHLLMAMTLEDRFDRYPLRGVSGAVIVADLRLDNRDDMLARIGIATSSAHAWSDSHVLLKAWERLGDAVWSTLRGPFAVAIWDSQRNCLTLARDHLGHSPLMWHRSDGFFAFATMPKGMFALPDVPRELNEEKLADFLVLNHADHATTMYKEIFRLRPAHIMKINVDGRVKHLRYWEAADIPTIHRRSDDAYAEGLRDCLDRAVRRQLRSVHPVGCYLSGGLDSSAVTILAARAMAARQQRLAAYTHVPRAGFKTSAPPGTYADETPYVEAIAEMAGNIDVHYIHNDADDDFADLERVFLAFEHPLRNPTNLGWMLAIPRRASKAGHRVLLGGFHGNLSISWDGWSQTAEHLRHLRLATVLRQWKLFYMLSQYGRWDALYHLLQAGRPESGDWRLHSAIHPDFAAAAGVAARARASEHGDRKPAQSHQRFRNLWPADYHGEWREALKAMTGVEIRDPTSDIDVIDYCLATPPEQFLAEGIDRSLVRRAMWGMLPKAVLTNRLRGLQSADWFEKLASRKLHLKADLGNLSTSPLVRRVIDVERLERALANWPGSGRGTRAAIAEYELALPRGLAAARFLNWIESANRGAAGNRSSC